MDMWEAEHIYGQNIPQLRHYRRYIDDLIILWDGTEDSLETFIEELNNNRFGITFTGSWHNQSVDYLDLQIFKHNGELCTRTFFKKTDRNGYISTSSCHHPQWIGNIPKGQLLRVRRNCRRLEDFDIQAEVLKEIS